ncbi:MAG: hypothetical protein U9N81_09150 [Bacillota bacterium]|nr:hypothetical protein [Bacillota bacterium]
MDDLTKRAPCLTPSYHEQQLAFKLIKRMVLAWDSDFTKLTTAERERLIKAEKEIAKKDTVNHLDIDWN